MQSSKRTTPKLQISLAKLKSLSRSTSGACQKGVEAAKTGLACLSLTKIAELKLPITGQHTYSTGAHDSHELSLT